jgi:subtilisin family serine protease
MRISGSSNSLAGAVEYVTLFRDGGDQNRYPLPAQVAASEPPLRYALADFRSGGAIAEAARSEGRYTVIDGDLDVSEPRVLDGLYYVRGTAKLSANALRGSFTIVAEGMIDVSGSGHDLRPYADGLLLFSGKQEVGASLIKVSGSNSALHGAITAPGGTVELSGSANSFRGVVLGNAIRLNGSALNIAFAAEYCPSEPEPPAEAYTAGEVVVKLFDAADLAAVAQAHGLNPSPIDQFGTRPIFRLSIIDGADPEIKAAQLRPPIGIGGDARVEYAEANYIAQTPEGRKGRGSWVVGEDEGGYAEQWAPTRLRLAEAHALSRGAGVTVAVLDTGVDPDHPALAGRLAPGFDFVDFDADPREVGVYGSNPGFGHGTHVAGLVALAAPDAKIMPVRVLDSDGVGNIWVLSEGLLFAVEQGPDGQSHTGDEAQVINLSLGTLRRTQLIEELFREMRCDADSQRGTKDRCGSGVVVIAAAGNGGDSVPQYPAAEQVEGLLAVGASTAGDARADFSTYGPWVRLASPGELIVSTVPGGGYGTWSGTSMAAPLAAGAAALVRAASPLLDAEDVIEQLVDTAAPICGLTPRRLDAAAALGAAPAPPRACATQHRLLLPIAVP